MITRLRNLGKFHMFIFVLLSFQLIILTPVAFLNKFLAIAICLLVLFNLDKLPRIFESKRWYNILFLIIVNSYLTLAIFGFDLFLEPRPEYLIDLSYYRQYIPEADFQTLLSMAAPYISIIYFVLGFIWTSYVLRCFLFFIDSFIAYKESLPIPEITSLRKKWLILFAITFSVLMIWQRAFYPAIMTDDSWGYLSGWQFGVYHTGGSPLYAFLINIICRIAPTKPEIVWIVITQIIIFSALLSSILMYFHKRRISFKYAASAAFILPLIPSISLHTVVIWIDLPNGMAILWFIYVLVRIIEEVIINKTATKKTLLSLCVMLCLSMVLTFFMRANSFPVYIVMAVALTVLFILKRNWQLLTAVILSVVIVLLIRFPGYQALGVYTHEQTIYHKYLAGIQDIQSTYYRGGNFSNETLTKLKQLIPRIDEEELKDSFQPDWTRYLEYDLVNIGSLGVGEFIALYWDSFSRNPAKMLSSMLYRVRTYWVIDAKGYINTISYSVDKIVRVDAPVFIPEFNVAQKSGFLTNLLHKYAMGTSLPLPAIFIWRHGIWMALMVICALISIIKRQFIRLLPFLPIFTYVATLYLTNAWADFRYGLPVFLSGLFLPLAFLLWCPKEGEDVSI